MSIVRAEVLGFCMGVRRAVELAEAEIAAAGFSVPAGTAVVSSSAGLSVSAGLDNQSGPPGCRPLRPMYTLGPLIHNPQVLASLTSRGVCVIDEDSTAWPPLENAVVIIRAHGVSPAVEAELRRRGGRIVDATCPRVKASQNIATNLTRKGRPLFIAGERDHAEVRGIAGYAVGQVIIVGNAAEAEAAGSAACPAAPPEIPPALIAQTTFSPEEYAAIAEILKGYFPGMEVYKTICGATRDRQNALQKLCAAVDAVIIAGGKDSANTRRLLSIAEGFGIPAVLAESAADLFPLNLAAEKLRNCGAVGLSAGASTPDSVIEEIAEAVEKTIT